jgi:ElaB/YqjD/DUF883 family membrane-anchored ribosome-binding protein
MERSNQPAQGAGLMDKVRQGASTQMNTQKDRATEGIGSVAQAVRQSSQQLRDQHHETIAQYIDQAAGQLERFSTRLRERRAEDLLQDAQRFARRNPALFVGSAFAAGLLAARFLKSSSHDGGDRHGYFAGGDGAKRMGRDDAGEFSGVRPTVPPLTSERM